MRECLLHFIQSQHFKRIIRLTFIHRLAIPFWVKDKEGEILYYVRHDRSWCKVAKSAPHCRKMCSNLMDTIPNKVVERKKAFMQYCHLGLISFCMPLMIEGELVGALGGCQIVGEGYKGEGVKDWEVDEERFLEALKEAERVQERILLAELELVTSLSCAHLGNIKEQRRMQRLQDEVDALNLLYHHCNPLSISAQTPSESYHRLLDVLAQIFASEDLLIIRLKEQEKVIAQRGWREGYSLPKDLKTLALMEKTLYIPLYVHKTLWGALLIQAEEKEFTSALLPHLCRIIEAITSMEAAQNVRVEKSVLDQKIKDLSRQEEEAHTLCKQTEELVKSINFEKVEPQTLCVLKEQANKLKAQETQLLSYIKDLEFHARQLEEWAARLRKEEEKAFFYRREAENLRKKAEQLKAQLKKLEEEAQRVSELVNKAESVGQLRERARELSLLLSFSKDVAQINDPYQLMRFATKRIKDMFNAHIVSYLLLEENKYVGELSSISPITQKCKDSLKEHSKELLSALTKKTMKIPRTEAELLKSMIFSPIFEKRAVVGLITVASFKEDAFGQKDEQLLSMLCAHLSIAFERAREFAHLKEASERDELTGLYNFRYFERFLKICFQEASVNKTPLSLILIDFDNLKKFNDALGHQYGNALLKIFAKLLLRNARKKDCVARYGGDEFVFVLPSTDSEAAYKVAQRIRERIEKDTFSLKGKQCKITACFGIATYPVHACKSAETLVTLADQALYAAKSMGKNQICAYDVVKGVR